MAGQGTDRGKVFHQPLERHILMSEGLQSTVADPAEQLGEAGVTGQIGAQDEGVDEETDQVVEGLVGAPGDRGTDGDVGPAPSRDNSTARPACRTMNTVTPCSRASSTSRPCRAGGTVRGTVSPW